MLSQVVAILALVVAVLVAVFATALPIERINAIIMIAKFFDIMLPILGVGALAKYLLRDITWNR